MKLRFLSAPFSDVAVSTAADLTKFLILERTAAGGGCAAVMATARRGNEASACRPAAGRRTLRGRARSGWE